MTHIFNSQNYVVAFNTNVGFTFSPVSLRDKLSLNAINATEASLELPDLDYNVDYSAYVTASTRFGDGKTRSSTINFRTPEGGESSGISINLKNSQLKNNIKYQRYY